MQDLAARILDYFEKSGIKSIRPKELAGELRIARNDFSKFKEAIEQLLEADKLAIGKSKQLRLKAQAAHLSGTIRRSTSGAGYFRPLDPTVLEPDESLYIAPEDLHDAFTGDEVQVQMLRRRMRGKRCGRVVEVVKRASTAFVGTYFEKRNNGFVRVEGGQFESAISVGDPGAKGARPEDQVVVEILRFPSRTDAGEAVITKVLGPRGTPGVDLLTIMHEFGLPDEFPEVVLAAARSEAQKFEAETAGWQAPVRESGENLVPSTGTADVDASPPPTRVDGSAMRLDLTAETIVTIDPVDARDFDDAISLEREDGGNWRLGVHIADVAHFVRLGSPLDKEARHRGTSVYLPDKVLPMLPEVISNSLASLQQGRIRYTKSAFITFNSEGTPLHSEFANTIIKVTQRFAYEQVLPLIGMGKATESDSPSHEDTARETVAKPDVSAPVLDLLKRMHELAMILRRRRFTRGALDLALPEVKIDIDRDGHIAGAHVVSHDESHQMIEEFMLAANVAVATKLSDSGVQFLRRTHASPDERKLRALSEFVGSLGYKIRSMPGRGDLQKLLKEVHGTPHEYAVSYAVLRSTKRAEYKPDPDIGHYALAEENYCHFTSPIRRYPDLTVHRLLDRVIQAHGRNADGAQPTRRERTSPADNHAEPSADLVSLGQWCSQTERRADDAEKELIKLKMLEFLAERIGMELDATITGVERFGVFCLGIQLPAEGLVHISGLPDDRYDYDDRSHTLVGRKRGLVFRLGGSVRVVVAEVDLVNRSLKFQLATPGRPPRKPEKKQEKRPSGIRRNKGPRKK